MGDPVLPAVLAPYVASLTAYDVRYAGPGVHVGLPSTALTLVLALDEPLDVGWVDEPGPRTPRWASVAGLHARPAAIHHTGAQRGIQLSLTTAGCRALLGLPAGAVAGEIVEAGELDAALRHLPEQLAGEPAETGRTRLVVRALVQSLARHDAPEPRAEVGRALARLTRGVSVGAVADEVGYSRRHLGSLVRAETGLGPKALQRVARFEHSRVLLGRAAGAGTVSLANLAAASGYADQSHLAREWRALAGLTPSTWLTQEFPYVQDVDHS